METISTTTLGIILAALIVLSAFFSGSETGLIALNRYRLKHRADRGHKAALRAQRLLSKPDRLIGLILLGNNLVNILAASISSLIAIRLLGESGIWVSTGVLTVIILIFAELAPKTMAVQHPERIAFPAAYVLTPLLKLLYPVVVVINFAADAVLRLFRIRPQEGAMHQLTRDELRTIVSDEHRDLSSNHQQMLLNILDLEHGRVEDVMVPRQEITGLDISQPWENILQSISQSLYTRLPVYLDDLDNLVGFLHVRTIITKLAQGRLTFEDVRKSVRKPYFIPEGTALTQQLLEFQRLERRVGMVIDEYGDIQGLVTLDDILEEIVGDYTSDARIGTHKQVRRMDDGTWLIDASISLRQLNRQLEWDLPVDGAATLNGLILEMLESIPEGKVALRIGEQIFTIAELGDNAIRKVLVKSS
ncbi:MAG: HlyC/CorC family transporter [Gammaproteobacteria bacterium]|jgi:Mg2+/Co2+ transporter CorB|nr:HlyC/CorC family transporter [Gammaproteobacteria bacterium]